VVAQSRTAERAWILQRRQGNWEALDVGLGAATVVYYKAKAAVEKTCIEEQVAMIP
jgi:hypothetical protein